jgi:hypothetical protein
MSISSRAALLALIAALAAAVPAAHGATHHPSHAAGRACFQLTAIAAGQPRSAHRVLC